MSAAGRGDAKKYGNQPVDPALQALTLLREELVDTVMTYIQEYCPPPKDAKLPPSFIDYGKKDRDFALKYIAVINDRKFKVKRELLKQILTDFSHPQYIEQHSEFTYEIIFALFKHLGATKDLLDKAMLGVAKMDNNVIAIQDVKGFIKNLLKETNLLMQKEYKDVQLGSVNAAANKPGL